MSIQLNLRYQKQDKFGSEIFIASNKYDEEKAAFNTLKKLEKKIKEMNVDTFLPVYVNEDLNYATIRFKFYKGMKLYERNLYSVTFVVKKSQRNGEQYINCFINNIKLHKKAPVRDDGEIVDLGI